jgi:hypothetical protein
MRLDIPAEFDLFEMRALVRWAFDIDAPKSFSMLAEMQTRLAKGERKLKRSTGSWATQVSATATRRAQYSTIPLTDDDFLRSRVVRAIFQLEYPHPVTLSARFHTNATAKRESIEICLHLLMREFRRRTPETKERIQRLAEAYFHSPFGVSEPWEVLGMTADDWKNSTEKQNWADVKRFAGGMESEAMQVLWVGL